MTAFSIPLKLDFFNVAVSSLSTDLPFKSYFLFFNPRLSSIAPFFEPLYPLDYILGVGQGRVIVLVDLPSLEPDKQFLDFCERLAIGHMFTQDENVRH